MSSHSGTHDIRPFERIITSSIFTYFPNTFDPVTSLSELSKISCEPTGMAWSKDNSTLFFADGHSKNVSKCKYDIHNVDVSDCATLLDVAEEISEKAVPRGMAVDDNDHLWVALSNGKLIELNTDHATVISTIGRKYADDS